MGERRGTKGLELWCRRMTEGYPGVEINNMTTSWRDGLAFCAIIHHFRPDLIDFSKLNKNDIYKNNLLAFQIAEHHLGIPALLEPDDMVKFTVPDRLSILTYLSQFYQTFVVAQGSAARTVPKRLPNTEDRESVSPTSSSPPTKLPKPVIGAARREPCANCGLPVVIAERIRVNNQLYHRTCFTCNLCNSQLTLANFRNINNQFCCETCPDFNKLLNLQRSLSDEEKSATLKMLQDDDQYSSSFESALENSNDEILKKSHTLDKDDASLFLRARTRFITSQLDNSDDDTPDLPDSVPPEIATVNEPPDLLKFASNQRGEENLDLVDHTQDNIFSDSVSSDNNLPVSCVTVNSLSDSDKNQPVTANVLLEHSTKDESVLNESSEGKLVIDNTISDSDYIHKEEDTSNDSKSIHENEEILEDSIIVISSDDSKEPPKEDLSDKDYPDDLNPFGDEDENSTEASVSLNPFDCDEDEDNIADVLPQPPIRKKIPLICVSPIASCVTMSRISVNPFDQSDVEASVFETEKLEGALKIISDDDIDEETDQKQPVPSPRKTTNVEAPQPTPRQSVLENSSIFGSNESLSSLHSSIDSGRHRKKQAPKPPASHLNVQSSIPSSVASTPCTGAQHSPKLTLKSRKTKKAPLPPTSTPYFHKERMANSSVSPICVQGKSNAEDVFNANEIEQEKIFKDEWNRNRQIIPDVQRLSHVTPTQRHLKGPAPSRPVAEKRKIKLFPLQEIKHELDVIEIQMQGLEKQGLRVETLIRDKCEGPDADIDRPIAPEVDDLILELFEIVNERNALFRRQSELVHLRRQQRLEEEHVELEYQIRCLLLTPEVNKTDCDKAREEELIKRLYEVVEQRNEIVEILDIDRVREAEEDCSIQDELISYTSKNTKKPSSSTKKKMKKIKFKGHKSPDADIDTDERNTSSSKKEKKKKKFTIF